MHHVHRVHRVHSELRVRSELPALDLGLVGHAPKHHFDLLVLADLVSLLLDLVVPRPRKDRQFEPMLDSHVPRLSFDELRSIHLQ